MKTLTGRIVKLLLWLEKWRFCVSRKERFINGGAEAWLNPGALDAQTSAVPWKGSGKTGEASAPGASDPLRWAHSFVLTVPGLGLHTGGQLRWAGGLPPQQAEPAGVRSGPCDP